MPTRARPQQLTLTPQAGPQSPTQGCGPALGQHGAEDTHLPSRRAAPPSRARGRGGGAGPSSHTPKGVRERGGGGERRHSHSAADSSSAPPSCSSSDLLLPARPSPSRADKSAGQSGRSSQPRPFPLTQRATLAANGRFRRLPRPRAGRSWPRPLPVTPPNEEAAGAGARTGGSVGPAPPRRWGDVVRGWCPSRPGVFSAIVCNVLDLEGTAWFSGSAKAKYF